MVEHPTAQVLSTIALALSSRNSRLVTITFACRVRRWSGEILLATQEKVTNGDWRTLTGITLWDYKFHGYCFGAEL